MEPYPVYFEKDGEFVAEFKFTVLLMPNNTMKITGLPLDLELYQSENSITDEAIKVIEQFFGKFKTFDCWFYVLSSKNLLSLSLVTKKKKKKKSKKAGDKKDAANAEESSDDEKEEPKK